jgi:hypothetical protein
VQVALRDGIGGEFVWCDDDPCARITVGADHDAWGDVVAVVLHEAEEAVAVQLLLRFSLHDSYARDRLSLLFVMTHPQLSEVCARVGPFLAACLPEIEAAWKQWIREAGGGR